MSYRYRYLCDVLDEMRKCDTTKNYAMLASLIEEAQIMGNKMEAKLYANKDLETLTKEVKLKRKKLKKLNKKITKVEEND